MILRRDYCYYRSSSGSTGFDFALGSMYVRNHFDESSKTELTTMMGNLEDSFASILQANDWMDDTSRTAALEKAHAMISNIAYPDWLLVDDEVDAYYSEVRTHIDGAAMR